MPDVVDKYTPTYDLESFKHSQYGINQSALSGAAAMGFERDDILQAVYHVPYKGYVIYVKFTQGVITEFDLLSFKEK